MHRRREDRSIVEGVGGEVRYSGDPLKNGILRVALFDVWERRCYHCRRWYDGGTTSR